MYIGTDFFELITARIVYAEVPRQSYCFQYLSIGGCCAKLWLYNILVSVPLSALTGSWAVCNMNCFVRAHICL